MEEEESEDDEDGPAPVYRRMGLPARVLVEREGDRYILSRNAGNEAIEAVLWFRRRALQWYGLPRTAILPYSVHSEALGHFKKWFKDSILARRAVNCCRKFEHRGDAYGSQTLARRHSSTPSRMFRVPRRYVW